MFKDTFSLINRDKWKWLSFLVGYILFNVVYAVAIWCVGMLTWKMAPFMGTGNAYSLYWGFVRCFGVLPLIAIGFFIYWAGNVKLEKSKLGPWLFWGSFLFIITLVVFLFNGVIGPYIYHTFINVHHNSEQVASGAFWIYTSTTLVLIAARLLLWPCMLSVWEKERIGGGYKIALLDWKKTLAWLGLAIGLEALGRWISVYAVYKFPFPPAILEPCSAFIYQLFLMYGYAILIYFFAVWVAQKPCVSGKGETSQNLL